jgi:hypothetical protein
MIFIWQRSRLKLQCSSFLIPGGELHKNYALFFIGWLLGYLTLFQLYRIWMEAVPT